MFNKSSVDSINIAADPIATIGADYLREVIQIVNYVILCGIISIFGVVTNILNLIVFYKQGLDTTINISFFALAVSDLCSLITQQCYNIFVNPWLEKVGVPGAASGIQFIVAGVPRECFARVTCLITVYITAERCLCIAFPLHIKQIITPERTFWIMACIYGLTMCTFIPLYVNTYIAWKVYPDSNATILALIFRPNSELAEGVVMVIHAISGTISFLAVVIFTIILIQKLGQKNNWRKSASVDAKQTEAMSNRDMRTMKIIVLIATVLIVCYMPSVVLYLATFIEPEFSIGGQYASLYTEGWSFACVFECINSSVNIFLYIKMSSKYRETFNALWCKS